MYKSVFFSKKEKNLETKFNEIYCDSLEKVQHTEKYKHIEMKINSIKKALKEHTDAPEILIDFLIDSIQEKNELEFKNANESIVKYTKNLIT